ncbi:MAG: phosphoglycerate mutase [Bacillales bacterium]|jgi:uncharacterized phosphatase|nr:phosphoglycerate mutase [Bacillales bacterium]
MTEICLVRHGQTDWNFSGLIQGREDIPLNRSGMIQARESAKFLSNEKWDIIVTSPLSRAYDTAKIIALELNLDIDKIQIDERLIERNFGEASGKDYKLYKSKYSEGKVVGMESDDELINRCFSAIQDIMGKYMGKRIIIVAHSHAIKAILHKISPNEVNFTTKLNNACTSYISCKENKWELLKYNISDHITI